MDREIGSDVRRRRVLGRVAIAVLALTAIAFSFAATIEWLRPSLSRSAVRTARVERGALEATVQAHGTVVPLIEEVVSSPVEARVLRIGRRAGDRVKAGDELLTLDTSAARIDAARLGDRVEQKEAQHAELRLKLDEAVASLRAQIEQKKLDAEIVRYMAEQKSRLRADGLIAEQDALAAEAAAKKSTIELRQLREALERALRSREVQLAGSESDVAIARRERDEARRQLELAMLRADRDGVLTWVITEAGATVRRGDVLARIADLSAYRVEATVSDVHASRIAAGMRTRVKVDETTIGGMVESVDPRIVNGVMKFHVTLDEPSHPRLRNNLRVDVNVISGGRAGALVVRRGYLGRTNVAFVVRGDTLVRVPVRFGLTGDETIEIVEGLRAGDEVVISDTTEYEDIKEVRLK